ncbi:hypothetical protein F5Y10DRAFT_265217 [Nemania abortiva]|nr:hypothetical protein F5Y10DRAFT_265217 [Nemania abortiva]
MIPRSALFLGEDHELAENIDRYCKPRGFSVHKGSKPGDYDKKELGRQLAATEPEILVFGPDYNEYPVNEIVHIFAVLARGVLRYEDPFIVTISDSVLAENGKDGIPEWVFKTLENYYR